MATNSEQRALQAALAMQQQLSAAVVEKTVEFFDYVSRGFSVREAYDKTMGPGAFMKLMGDVYDEIRARAAAQQHAA